ncbi:hypothetical protein NMY22_g7445 [Coprinellus aureogranulatus]|nr:hypothetical protein NMY22_g7445 [Coprinellus aureogranulatus]
MIPPSSFPSLSSLLWNWKKDVYHNPSAAVNLVAPAEQNVPTRHTIGPRRSLPIFERLRPSFWRSSLIESRRSTVVEPSGEPPKPLPESWFNGMQQRPIFAVIIGIDRYPNLPHLRGAVNDANAVSTYVKSELHVPAERIIVLRNEQATRAGILRTFHSLRLKNPHQPRKGDSIILYYAGYAGPQETSVSGIQTVVPWDYNGDPDNTIPAVTSLELIALLKEVKRVKGDHITFIFDSGGSATQVHHQSTGVVSARVIELAAGAADMDSSLSEKEFVTGNIFILSACSLGEAAREVHGRGLFTTALIKLLKQEGSTNMTRANLLARLPQITAQTPNAYVEITDCPMFDTGLVPPEHVALAITEDKRQYTVHAGSVAGVTPGSRFFVYRARARLAKKKPKVFVADRISLFTTTLRPFFHSEAPHKPLLKLPAAIPYGSGQRHDLVVEVALKDALVPLYQVILKLLLNEPFPPPYSFLFTEDCAKADLSLDVCADDGNFLKITILDERVAVHGYTKIPQRIPLINDDVERFLLQAAHFYRHLNHCKPNEAVGQGVSIEMLKLVTSGSVQNQKRRQRRPTGSNILAHGVAEVRVHSQETNDYGFRITNHSDRDLYPHLLYFDNSVLGVADYYPHGAEVPPIAKKGGVLTIGYENPGTAAFTFVIPEGQDLDVGFVKVLFSTTPLDLSSIVRRPVVLQATDADEPRQIASGSREGTTGCGRNEIRGSERELVGLWGSVMFCAVQRRSTSATPSLT